MREGVLLVLIGPSGTGKTTLANMLVESDREVKLSTSITTRKPRSGEEEGAEYTFVTKDNFSQMIEKNLFIEYAEVYGDFYGTSRTWVNEQIRSGQDVLLVLDIQGGQELKKQLPNACTVCVLPPSIKDLHRRLAYRASDDQDSVVRRIEEAPKEIKAGLEFCDFILINDDVPRVLFDLISILRTKRLSLIDRNKLYEKIS